MRVNRLAPAENLGQKSSWNWIHSFMVGQFILQILLLFPQFGAARVVMRVLSFAISLGLLFVIPATGHKHPSVNWAIAVLGIMVVQFFFHPDMSTLLAGLAQCALYLGIIAPVFWVTRLNMTLKSFYWLILIIWSFHTVSSIVGVLQVLYPSYFQTILSTSIQSSGGGEGLKIVLANGETIFRPQGLTDVPGGAASAGYYALLLSTGIAIYRSNFFLRLVCLVSASAGFFCIYLSQVRSILVLAVVALISFFGFLIKQGYAKKVSWMVPVATGIAVFMFSLASKYGGESTTDRLSTLTAKGAGEVYYENRGTFLESTLDFALKNPLGSGLGRWGTIGDYFGDRFNPIIRPIYVEIQWTAWVIDGGVPMVIAYLGAIFMAMQVIWSVISREVKADLVIWGSLILAYDVGAVAITFNYPLFIGQGGMEFWILNTAFYAVTTRQRSYEISHNYGRSG
jgi:hypothetical protein